MAIQHTKAKGKNRFKLQEKKDVFRISERESSVVQWLSSSLTVIKNIRDEVGGCEVAGNCHESDDANG